MNKETLYVKVPATSANLGPGFDTLGLAVSIYNEIKITEQEKDEIIVKGEGEHYPIIDFNKNMFYRIFKEIINEISDDFTDTKWKFEFFNEIPLSRGLGSSSSIIVAAVSSAYNYAGIRTSKKNILNISLRYEEHPDNITPALYGGFTVSALLNDKVTFNKCSISNDVVAILVIPNKRMNTSNSRNKLKDTIEIKKFIWNNSRTGLMVSAFYTRNWKLLKEASKDKVHQYSRMTSYPILFRIQKKALSNNALMSTLSGSGSSFFNLVLRKNSTKLKEELEKEFTNFKVLEVEFDNNGLTYEWRKNG
jgi:homoserine kinase